MKKLLFFVGFTKVGRHFVFGLLLALLAIIFVVTVAKLKQNSTNGGALTPLPNNNTRMNNNDNIVTPRPLRADEERQVIDYHRMEENWCEAMIANRTTVVGWCPCVPSGLHGRIPINMVDDDDWAAIEELVGREGDDDVRSGGEWSPRDCVPRTRVAVIIPCRDRESHLRVLLRHLFPVLKRQMIHFRVFVVDQRRPMLFNKAATMDAGFLEATKRFAFDCVVFHDVDLLLEDDRALFRCGGPTPRHYVRALDKFRYKGYLSFGGVVAITPDMFRQVNGYPLQYFGWGGEDDDMWARVSKRWPIYRIPSVVGRYTTIPHGRDPTNRKNPRRIAIVKLQRKRIKKDQFDGLTDLVYSLNDVDLRPLFTRFEMDINVTAIVEYPQQEQLQQQQQQLSYSYRRAIGICMDPDVILVSSAVSWTTCRFLCDNYVERHCFGFSYSDGGMCALIRAVCSLTALPGWTYVKQ